VFETKKNSYLALSKAK